MKHHSLMRCGAVLLSGALLSALVFAAPPAAAKAAPTDYAELLKALQRTRPSKKRAVALTLAKEERASVSDRLRALTLLAPSTDAERLDDDLLGAYLFTIARNERGRARRLARATALAKATRDPRHAALVRVQAADKQYAAAQRLLKRRTTAMSGNIDRRAPPLSPDEARLQSSLYDAAAYYSEIGDKLRGGEVAFLLARLLELSDAPREAVLRAFTPLLRAGGSLRATAPLRQRVRRARARVLVELGRYRQAAYESLVADHIRIVPANQADFEPPGSRRYERSAVTEKLCRAVFEQSGIDCAEIQRERMDAITFYDFTRGPRRSALDRTLSDRVWAEYASLVHDCRREHGALKRELRLSWTVAQTGRVTETKVAPPGDEAITLCLKTALDSFRYPRHGGEPWHEVRRFP